MPKDSNDDANIDELLAELKNETSEESDKSKKKPVDEHGRKYDNYEYQEQPEKDNDENW